MKKVLKTNGQRMLYEDCHQISSVTFEHIIQELKGMGIVDDSGYSFISRTIDDSSSTLMLRTNKQGLRYIYHIDGDEVTVAAKVTEEDGYLYVEPSILHEDVTNIFGLLIEVAEDFFGDEKLKISLRLASENDPTGEALGKYKETALSYGYSIDKELAVKEG